MNNSIHLGVWIHLDLILFLLTKGGGMLILKLGYTIIKYHIFIYSFPVLEWLCMILSSMWTANWNNIWLVSGLKLKHQVLACDFCMQNLYLSYILFHMFTRANQMQHIIFYWYLDSMSVDCSLTLLICP